MDKNLAEKCMGIAGVEVKDAGRGEVEAIVARTGIPDLDGDVFLPGAFGTRDVRVSEFNHRSWPQRGGLPPVGRGTIREQGDEVVASLRFFMSTKAGREAFETVKGMGELQQWSFGWVPGAEETARVPEGTKAKRAIRSVPVEEVSPVLIGASVGTRTVAAKCERCSTAAAETSDDADDGKRPRNIVQTDPEAVKLAGFAVDVAHELHGTSKHAPAYSWFVEEERLHNGIAPQFPSVAGHHIRLASHLRGRELVSVALHESRHLYQDEDADVESRERDAERFASRWTDAVLRAFEATAGSTRGLYCRRDRRPPFYRGNGRRWQAGDLVLAGDGHVWTYNPKGHNAWMKER